MACLLPGIEQKMKSPTSLLWGTNLANCPERWIIEGGNTSRWAWLQTGGRLHRAKE